MPSVEDGPYYEDLPFQEVYLQKGEAVIPLDGALSEEDIIMIEGLQARMDALKGELESRGLSLNDLTSDYFLHLPENDDDPNSVG